MTKIRGRHWGAQSWRSARRNARKAGLLALAPAIALLANQLRVAGAEFAPASQQQRRLADASQQTPAPTNANPAPRVSTPTAAGTNLPVLVEIIDIRELSPREAARGYPVRVTGVLTYCEPQSYKQFIQDDSAGIYLDLSKNQSQTWLVHGQKVEVTGFSGPGDYAPVIHAQQVQVLGQSPFPPAKPTTIQRLMSGSEDSQWVELRGVIRDLLVSSNQTELTLSTGDALLKVQVPQGGQAPADYIDAAVAVRGVCITVFNARRRLEGVALEVPAWSEIEVTEAPTELATLAVRPIDELFEFRPGSSGLHRARLQGAVSLCQADGSFYLQDATGGIHVQGRDRQSAPAGATIEVIGFPAMADKLPALQDALVKSVPGGLPVAPRQLDPNQPLDAACHATLVRLEGRVLGKAARPGQELLTVEFGQRVIDVVLELEPGREPLARLALGSVVGLTGVFVARLDDERRIQSFQLMLRSAQDVVIISRPSWWTPEHTFWGLTGLGTVLLAALAWVGLLRKQVQRRTRELRAEIAHHQRTEAELKRAQGDLLQSSRLAGMAEVATSVLHNVGNVLNSVNVSACLAADQVKSSHIGNVARVAELLREHAADLGEFITSDPRGRQLSPYLGQLAKHLAEEQAALLTELDSLKKNVEHIKDIVALQQNYAKVAGLTERVNPTELVEHALRMHAGALLRHNVEVLRDYEPGLPQEVTMDKHKTLQILVNLVHNAKYACSEAGGKDKRLIVRVANGAGRLRFSVTDNGVGIPPENLTCIFNHGFTTRKNGHGFALHSGALAAKEMGGALLAHSDGPGRGATFTLELPAKGDGS